jgi:hypothetical protein
LCWPRRKALDPEPKVVVLVDPKSTVGGRLANYRRWQKFGAYFGAALGAVVLISAQVDDVFNRAYPWIEPLFITLLLASGTALGLSVFGYTYAEKALVQYQVGSGCRDSSEAPTGKEYSHSDRAHDRFQLSVWLGAGAVAVLILLIWADAFWGDVLWPSPPSP